jgi:peptidoglycan/LPS O-acetylase OafA/YrhL
MSNNNKKKDWVDSWQPNPSLNKEYEFIDGLRGMAILMVVACHLIYENRTDHEWVTFLYRLIASGNNGVTLFFVLSGFLISWPFWRYKIEQRKSVLPAGYIQRRFFKIYPPLALSMVILVPVYIFLSNDLTYINDALMHLSGLSLFMPVAGKMNPVVWSLIVEIQFYIILPLLFLLFKKASPLFTLISLTLLFLIVPFIVRYHNHQHGIQMELHPVILLRFPTKLDAFGPGILLCGLFCLGLLRKSVKFFGYLGLFLLLLSLCLSAIWKMNIVYKDSFVWKEMISMLFMLSGAGLLCFIVDPNCFGSRLFSFPLLRFLGVISYEWYLFHQVIYIWFLKNFIGPANGSIYKYAGTIVLSLILGFVVSIVVYRFFSLPLLVYGRNRFSPPPRSAVSIK